MKQISWQKLTDSHYVAEIKNIELRISKIHKSDGWIIRIYKDETITSTYFDTLEEAKHHCESLIK